MTQEQSVHNFYLQSKPLEAAICGTLRAIILKQSVDADRLPFRSFTNHEKGYEP